jgi:16S rRNA (uracil1498-N3)-methyltransferase
MQRSQARIKSERLEKRVHHWQGIIISACEQSGRATLPQLSLPEDFTGWINASSTDCLRIMLQPGSQYRLRDMKAPAGNIYLLAGPEGGLNSDEQALARSCGFTGVQLGPRVLRTETAAITALAGMQTLWGDF